jgi:peptidoglycan/xylan/chitin deacetylase (PgdA/CDA1 family)
MPSAYLTIDDAPSGDLSGKLDTLDRHEVPAMLFCEGRRMADHLDRAVEAIERGYHLGNHTETHPHCSELSVAEFRRELDRTERRIEDAYDRAGVDRPAKLFRFPYGDRGGGSTADFQRVLTQREFAPATATDVTYDWYRETHAGARDWFWTVDCRDWDVASVEQLRHTVETVAADRLASSAADIVLFHDAGTDLALLDAFLEELQSRGVEFTAPTDALE